MKIKRETDKILTASSKNRKKIYLKKTRKKAKKLKEDTR